MLGLGMKTKGSGVGIALIVSVKKKARLFAESKGRGPWVTLELGWGHSLKQLHCGT